MSAIRLTPASHVLKLVDRLEASASKRGGSTADVIASAFSFAPGELEMAQLLYAQARHIHSMRQFVHRSDETIAAKQVYETSLLAFQRMFSFAGLAQPWSQHVQSTIPPHRPQLITLDSLIRPHLGTFPLDSRLVDDLESRLQSALAEMKEADVDRVMLARFEEMIVALIFGLRNADFLGAEFAWERASALMTEVAARSAKGQASGGKKAAKLMGVICAVVTLLAATNAAFSDINGILSNIEEFGSRAIEWEANGRRLIEDMRSNVSLKQVGQE